jgi:hypothetical protein
MYTSKRKTLLELLYRRFCPARVTHEKRQAFLLHDFRVRTVTHGAVHKTLDIPLNEPAERILRELALKDNPRTLSSRSSRHLTRQELHNVLRVTIQGTSNLLKIINHGAHANPRILQPGQLQTLTLRTHLRTLRTRPLQQILILVSQAKLTNTKTHTTPLKTCLSRLKQNSIIIQSLRKYMKIDRHTILSNVHPLILFQYCEGW